jgi:NAD(P)-dependent dehydrogenase (short-subunit alcohol dehydrogenase family)
MFRQQRVVVITGASAGVGRATVREFARQGAKIGLIARGKAGLEGAQRDAEQLGGQALICQADVAHYDQVEAAAEAVERHFGPIDVWINDAMCSVFSPVKEMTAEDYRRVTEVTYLGYVHGTLAALKRMLPRNRGAIIQVGSALAYRGIPLQSAYCAAKHAVQGFCDSLRSELLHDGSNVKLTMVQMPALNTPQFDWVKSRLPRKPQPVPPIYQPEVAAQAIAWAADHYRREWYVGGTTATAIIGNKIAPGVGDWYLARQGYEAQQYDGHVSPDRRDNIYKPVDEDRDFGAHGDFDQRSTNISYYTWLDQRRDWALLSALGGAVCSLVRQGPSAIFRGGLVGAAVGALGALGIGSLRKSPPKRFVAEHHTNARSHETAEVH